MPVYRKTLFKRLKQFYDKHIFKRLNTNFYNFRTNMKQLPIARKQNLIEQESDENILIYDLVINKAFSLNKTSAIVYKSCDGIMTFEELKKRTGLSEEIIFLTLDILQKNDLLESSENFLESFGDLSRRQIIRKVGLASMIALPLVSSLIAPSSAQARSGGCVQPGGQVSFSRSGIFGPSLFLNTCLNGINSQCCSGSATRNSFEDRCLCTSNDPSVPINNGVPATCAGRYTCN